MFNEYSSDYILVVLAIPHSGPADTVVFRSVYITQIHRTLPFRGGSVTIQKNSW